MSKITSEELLQLDTMSHRPEKIRLWASDFREQKKIPEAFLAFHLALESAEAHGEPAEIAHTFCDLCWLMLHEAERGGIHKDAPWLIWAVNTARTMLEIARKHAPEKEPTAQLVLGSLLIHRGEYKPAVACLTYAVEHATCGDAEKCDWKIRLLYAQAKGKKTAKVLRCAYESILDQVEYLSELKDSEDEFKVLVWTTGAYFKLAELYIDSHAWYSIPANGICTARANFFLKAARELIVANPSLQVRKDQYNKLLDKYQKEFPRLGGERII